MEILTGKQMREADRHAIEVLGIPALDLMEAAGRGVSAALWQDYPDLATRTVLILCGKGNNGGDGFVVARLLRKAGMTPGVVLFADRSELTGDAATTYEAAGKAGLQIASIMAGWLCSAIPSISAVIYERASISQALRPKATPMRLNSTLSGLVSFQLSR